MEVSKESIVYLAGLVDGDGSIFVTFPCEGRGTFTVEGQYLQESIFTQMRTLNQKWSMGKTRKDVLCAD